MSLIFQVIENTWNYRYFSGIGLTIFELIFTYLNLGICHVRLPPPSSARRSGRRERAWIGLWRGAGGAVEAAITKTALNGLMAPDGIDLNAGNLGTHNYHTRAAAYGPNTAAAPGHLTQGDVLSRLGSRLTMRGDTFVIRSYGDATEKNGKVLARAWCEAVVQRFPAHVDPTDPPEKPLDQLNATNQRFGRAFKLVSFRWLAPQEV